jgi:ribonuclease HI
MSKTSNLVKKSPADFFAKILIFSDGACSGNPGPGGWGAVIAFPEGEIAELGGGQEQTTNNEMELKAAIQALRKIKSRKEPVIFYTDSTYLIRGITQWIWGWIRNGWKTSEGQEVANQVHWQELSSLVRDRGSQSKIEWLYSRGHVGTPGNERCDEIAVAFSQKKWISLYQGPLLKYQIAIFDVPEDGSLPPMREKVEKKPAFSYLSYIGRQVYRHRDWSSCERRVKGQSGAKFKKALSSEDERSILESWGLPKDYPIEDAK